MSTGSDSNCCRCVLASKCLICPLVKEAVLLGAQSANMFVDCFSDVHRRPWTHERDACLCGLPTDAAAARRDKSTPQRRGGGFVKALY